MEKSKFNTITSEDWKKSFAMGRNEPNLVRLSIMKSIETLVLAHRYLKHVKKSPAISDQRFELIEAEARRNVAYDSPIHKPGSDNPKDYPKEAIELAEKLAA